MWVHVFTITITVQMQYSSITTGIAFYSCTHLRPALHPMSCCVPFSAIVLCLSLFNDFIFCSINSAFNMKIILLLHFVSSQFFLKNLIHISRFVFLCDYFHDHKISQGNHLNQGSKVGRHTGIYFPPMANTVHQTQPMGHKWIGPRKQACLHLWPFPIFLFIYGQTKDKHRGSGLKVYKHTGIRIGTIHKR